ncbi:MAG: hypothetical protein ACREDK_09025 [Thermoplasmata archaeon]
MTLWAEQLEAEVAPIDPKAQYNFTDPESRIMPDGANRGSFVQAYNCQAMVDAKAQIIVAAESRSRRTTSAS